MLQKYYVCTHLFLTERTIYTYMYSIFRTFWNLINIIINCCAFNLKQEHPELCIFYTFTLPPPPKLLLPKIAGPGGLTPIRLSKNSTNYTFTIKVSQNRQFIDGISSHVNVGTLYRKEPKYQCYEIDFLFFRK